jgi:hypothetical protein
MAAGSGALSALVAAQREAVARGDEMLVGAAQEVFAGAAGHQRFRIVTAV